MIKIGPKEFYLPIKLSHEDDENAEIEGKVTLNFIGVLEFF
jgi:hypothetical protein